MTQPTIRELAKQGDPQAIAILFNRALKPKGITTTASRIEDILSLIVEADPTPDREVIATTIHKGLTKLEVRSIRKVRLFGRQTGQEIPAWEREFILEIPEDETLEPLSERLQEPPKLDLSIEGEESEAQTPKDGMHEVGDVVRARYRILEQIGRGSNGITYKAEDLQTKELVAIKALSLRNMGDWKQIELFEREAKILEQLNHPAIPRYLDYFQIDTSEDRAFYIVQQLAEGQNLAKLVENGWRTNEKGVRKIAIQVLEILSYLHDLKPPVIHRDIKPHNLIYGNDGKIFLVDFGAVQDTYRSTMARGSTVVGTFGYMAPEQFQGQSVPATDLYALGATLLFLLTHRSPAELPQERLRYSFRSKVQISDDFANWLQKIVEPDLEERFHSAKEALGTLRGRLAIGSKLRKPISWKGWVGIGVTVAIIGAVIDSYKWTILHKFFDITPSVAHICNQNNSTNMKQKLQQLKEFINNVGYFTDQDSWCIYSIADREIFELLEHRNIGFDKNRAFLAARSVENIKWLIEKGVDVNTKDKDSNTRLHGHMSLDVANFLSDNDIRMHAHLSLDVAKFLIEKGLDINAKNNKGQTPLFNVVPKEPKRMYYVESYYVESVNVAKLLIENGADVNAKNYQGLTPLHVVRSADIAKLLIEKGANVNAKDGDGMTPLDRVVLISTFEQRDDNDIEMAKLLIEKGADVNTQNKYGYTLLDYERVRDDTEFAQLLIKNGAHRSRF